MNPPDYYIPMRAVLAWGIICALVWLLLGILGVFSPESCAAAIVQIFIGVLLLGNSVTHCDP